MYSSRQLVCILIKQTNLSYKRIRTRGTSKRKEELVHSFVSRYKNIQKDVKIVSIDESGFDQRAHPIYGYAQKGKKAIVTHSLSVQIEKLNFFNKMYSLDFRKLALQCPQFNVGTQ